jgi:hypothetical protein
MMARQRQRPAMLMRIDHFHVMVPGDGQEKATPD